MIGICVEWAQSRARAARWAEEVCLIVEEMRRVLYFLRWRKQWWMEKAKEKSDTRSDVKEGLRAYAAKEADVMEKLVQRFGDEWYPLLTARGLSVEWPEDLKRARKVAVEAVTESCEEK